MSAEPDVMECSCFDIDQKKVYFIVTDQGFTGKETVYLLELCLLRLSVLVHCVMQQNYCCPFGAMNLN